MNHKVLMLDLQNFDIKGDEDITQIIADKLNSIDGYEVVCITPIVTGGWPSTTHLLITMKIITVK